MSEVKPKISADLEIYMGQIESLCKEVANYVAINSIPPFERDVEKQLIIYLKRLNNLYGKFKSVNDDERYSNAAANNEQLLAKIMECDDKIVATIAEVEYELGDQAKKLEEAAKPEHLKKLPIARKQEDTLDCALNFRDGFSFQRRNINISIPLISADDKGLIFPVNHLMLDKK